MKQIHFVINRINPSLKIDSVRIGEIVDGQFKELPLSDFDQSPVPSFVQSSPISENPFIYHSSVSGLVSELSSFPGFAIEFFDNTMILMFDFNTDPHESSSKEENSRH